MSSETPAEGRKGGKKSRLSGPSGRCLKFTWSHFVLTSELHQLRPD